MVGPLQQVVCKGMQEVGAHPPLAVDVCYICGVVTAHDAPAAGQENVQIINVS